MDQFHIFFIMHKFYTLQVSCKWFAAHKPSNKHMCMYVTDIRFCLISSYYSLCKYEAL